MLIDFCQNSSRNSILSLSLNMSFVKDQYRQVWPFACRWSFWSAHISKRKAHPGNYSGSLHIRHWTRRIHDPKHCFAFQTNWTRWSNWLRQMSHHSKFLCKAFHCNQIVYISPSPNRPSKPILLGQAIQLRNKNVGGLSNVWEALHRRKPSYPGTWINQRLLILSWKICEFSLWEPPDHRDKHALTSYFEPITWHRFCPGIFDWTTLMSNDKKKQSRDSICFPLPFFILEYFEIHDQSSTLESESQSE